VRQYFERLWKEFVGLAIGTAVVVTVLTLFVRGGPFVPITGAIVLLILGFAVANIRLVIRLLDEKKAVETQLTTLQLDRVRLETERDEARRELDVAKTALAVLNVLNATRDVSVTSRVLLPLPPRATGRRGHPPKQLPTAAPDQLPAAVEPPAPPPELPAHHEELTPPPEEPNVGQT
jgi:hypothetical protein